MDDSCWAFTEVRLYFLSDYKGDPMNSAKKEMTLKVGDRAPDFSVSSTQGKIVLSQLVGQGPVVLALYPKDFTPG